jgi:hypothetical protein
MICAVAGGKLRQFPQRAESALGAPFARQPAHVVTFCAATLVA